MDLGGHSESTLFPKHLSLAEVSAERGQSLAGPVLQIRIVTGAGLFLEQRNVFLMVLDHDSGELLVEVGPFFRCLASISDAGMIAQ